MELSHQARARFQERLWDYYASAGRGSLPWRLPDPDGSFDPYKIMVSELMLQQTQVPRVVPKYHKFLDTFPTVSVLAKAELGDVLRVWQGLGYNRRAKFLFQAAQAIVTRGSFPRSPEELVQLPGIGKNTAGAILAYAYNQPALFVETNVRTVYIHHFLADRQAITDQEIMDLLAQTLDREQPRAFYWALMDYGSHLKATVGNLNQASREYTKQATFHGSRRQLRGQVIRELGSHSRSLPQLQVTLTDPRLMSVLHDLTSEDLIRQIDGVYSL